MAFYESIFITRQELGEKEIDKTIENFKSNRGGVLPI